MHVHDYVVRASGGRRDGIALVVILVSGRGYVNDEGENTPSGMLGFTLCLAEAYADSMPPLMAVTKSAPRLFIVSSALDIVDSSHFAS